MKKLLVTLMIAVVTLIAGCGSDGNDGNAYVAYDWTYEPYEIIDTNPSTPSVVYAASYFQSQPGTYYFSYENYYSSWTGVYTVTINKGEDGSFIADGDDGNDKYFDIFLSTSGPTLYAAKAMADQALPGADAQVAREVVKSSERVAEPQGEAVETYIEEKTNGLYSIRLEARKVK